MTRRVATLLAVCLLAACLCGCSKGSFTRQRWETLYVGQPSWDVRKVLGKPAYQDEETWIYVHDSRPYHRAAVHFRYGRVAGKDWSYERLTTTSQSAE